MAETVAIELVKVVFQKLTDEAMKRIARSQGIHNELKELRSTLSHIQAFLNDASEKEVTDKSVKRWLNGLQHLAYDINDVLDDLATEAMHHKLTLESGAIICSKVNSITSELQHLEKQKNDLGLIKKDEKPKNTSRRNKTSLPEHDVAGREVEKKKFLKMLLGEDGSSKENFSILPLVGMGGVGKTTLARLLYNDTKVQAHFELKVWVYVSREFDIFKISDTILQYVTRENNDENKDKNEESKDLNQLQLALVEQFKDKRFLLVVDDVWNENYDDWEQLVRPFHSGAHGSKIIMITRKDLLLKSLGFYHLDRLECLSQEDALSLFALHALGVDNFDLHPTLKAHGKGIVNKCGHLPLAIKAIGRLLRRKTNGEDWDVVLNSEIWDIEDGKHIIPALRLSFHDLSADLKQLFAYCCLFPKGYLFNKEELVLLWMAEGFLSPSNATKSPERSGHEYFEILLSRSFFQYAPNEESMFIMHDLMVDLATFVAGEFFLRFDNHTKTKTEDLAKYRHMSFTCEDYVGYHKFEAFKGAKSLRTLLAISIDVYQNFYLSNKVLIDLFPTLTLLRVLSLSHFAIREVPDSIGSLKHLRYLNLSETRIKELPEN
ncbi:putative virus X resistance protein-like, coiled-coil [Helianthus annuus]|nr:putative virus X resistance protein-like, coiled-coil [Helianthus annuus]